MSKQALINWAAKVGPGMRADLGLQLDLRRPEGVISPVGVINDWTWNYSKLLYIANLFRERFLHLVEAIESVTEARGDQVIIWDGLRSLERQAKLYARGRYGDTGTKVTYTMASLHLVGAAVDYSGADAKLRPTFKLPRYWKTDILPLAASCGLESLYLTKGIDLPHFQVGSKDLLPVQRAWLDRIRKEAPV